ncbi:hypothetical protein [Hymenobacter terrenus]|uniref:hypothetical protein n=1 Tax=Hymenobacter terrenus TaxID=1629124 RepID=UPI0012E00654|nr:hypothetical protein [Hymenobacter terrenus]
MPSASFGHPPGTRTTTSALPPAKTAARPARPNIATCLAMFAFLQSISAKNPNGRRAPEQPAVPRHC